MKVDTPSVASELASLMEASPDGKLSPSDIVNYAEEHPGSALYSHFEWNDSKAAHHYRLWQARKLLASIVMRPDDKTEPIRYYVQLRDDNEGYRSLESVVKDEDLFKRLDQQFRDDIKALRNRYAALKKYHEKLFKDIDEL